jgi:hypothetical protein
MNKWFLHLILICTTGYLPAQVTFQKYYGSAGSEQISYCHEAFGGGYILAGHWVNPSASDDMYLLKTDSMGNIEWTKTLGDTSYEESGSVLQTADSGFIINGYTASSGAGGTDVLLAKTDKNGNLVWSKVYGNTGFEQSMGFIRNNKGEYIISGYTTGMSTQAGIFMMVTNSAGNLLWSKVFPTGVLGSACLKQTADGGYIMGSAYLSGTGKGWLIKMDSTGTVSWSKKYGGSGTDAIRCVEQTSDGGYIAAGTTTSFGAAGVDIYLLRTDSAGSLLWSATYGGTGLDNAISVHQLAGNGFVIGGSSSSFGNMTYHGLLFKTDSAGNIEWSKIYNAPTSQVWDAWQTSDNGFILSGNGYNNGMPDLTLIKTDSSGNSGCISSDITMVKTIPATVVSAVTATSFNPAVIVSPATFTGDTLGTAEDMCSGSFIKEWTENRLMVVSPNPSKNSFTVTFSEEINSGILEIVNIYGERVFKKCIKNAVAEKIYLPVVPGIYFLRLTDGEKQVSKKIIIEHE